MNFVGGFSTCTNTDVDKTSVVVVVVGIHEFLGTISFYVASSLVIQL